MKIRIPLAVLVCLLSTQSGEAHRDHGSWKKTLHEKALYFAKNTAERHNIEGTYPSSVRLLPPNHYVDPSLGGWKGLVETGVLPPGWTFYQGTTGDSNIAHTSSWTGNLLTGEAFHVAFLRDTVGTDHPEYQAAYQRANEIIHGLRILTLVSGVPGYLARGIAYGHGISYAERGGGGDWDLWSQGVGEYQHFRYRGGPSHHNHDQVFHGLGIYYFVAADDAQKEAIREIVTDMSNWAHLSHDMRVMHTDGVRESTVLIGGWRGMDGDKEPSGGSLMATTGLKVAALITGNEEVQGLYDQWVDKLGYRDPKRTAKSIMGSARGNYDDTDHLLPDLYLLNLIEEDPELKRFYKKCMKDGWEAHKGDRVSWYTFLCRAVLGDECSDPEGSIWNLQTFPTCRIFQPQLNSLRNDIKFVTGNRGRKEAADPLPVYQRSFDNEYEWKGSPFALDGWPSRVASIVEVSPLDPYVIFAADTSGGAYVSLDAGELWRPMGSLPRVNDFLFSPDYSAIAFAATDGGIYRTLDGGRGWGRVSSHRATRLKIDLNNAHILYAEGPQGVIKSVDLGRQKMGSVWKQLTDPSLPGDVSFTVDLSGEEAILYMLTSEGVSTRSEHDSQWKGPAPAKRPRGFGDFLPVGGRPLWIRADEKKPGRLFRSVEIRMGDNRRPFLSVSEDGGKTWTPVLRKLDGLFQWAAGIGKTANITSEQMRELLAYAGSFPIRDIQVDSKNQERWYGLMESGVAVTNDGGENWVVSKEGLDFPSVQSLSKPRESDNLYVGTPVGLYVSRDGAETWHDTSLILQYPGVGREEIGGAAYIQAYWLGRYEGFITEEEANRVWWE
ncbi:MAG: WD40/YVTN/BNR-like repeat-containing protein [Pirellulales bacterium]